MRRIFLFVLLVCVALSLPGFAKRLTQGFRIAKMQLEFPFHPEWEIHPDPAVHSILKQPFYFIGKGAQSYVFESKDRQYVVKLFRYDHPCCKSKILHLFNACKMAYDCLRKETGLIYIHLNPTPMDLPTLRCKDAVGRSYKIDLNQTRFALQKRAEDFQVTLKKASQDPPEMKKRLDQFVDLLQDRTAKNILNSDPSLSRNFGFLEDRAIEFDFGNYRYSADLNSRLEIDRYALKLRRWLSLNAPEWVAYLDERLEAIE